MVIGVVHREEESQRVIDEVARAVPLRHDIDFHWIGLPGGEEKDTSRTRAKLGGLPLDAVIFFPGTKVVKVGATALVLRSQIEVRNRIRVFFNVLGISPIAAVARYLGENWGDHDGQTRVGHWLGQFARLQMPWVGERLLWLLDLRSPGQLIRGLGFTSQELSAYDALVFGRTTPKGKSADLLTAHLPRAVDFDRRKLVTLEEFVSRDLRRGLYVEDGLWSGTEAVRLLGGLSSTTNIGNLFDRLTFSFCVRTDLGEARLAHFAAQHERVARFRDGPMVRVLSAVGSAALKDGCLFGKDGKPLDVLTVVDPTCLTDKAWQADERSRAGLFLRTTGAQLFESYIRRRVKAEPGSFDEMRWPSGRLAACGLGMDNLGLTTVLGVSVPKGTLPHFWMEGNVIWRDRSWNWIPLFPNSIRP